jgi:bacteriocin biosynthesis cyclodehydratase domain-containing protein
MRPILRPGCHVLRRGDGDLQVGLDPRRAIVLAGDAPVRESLRLLQGPADRQEYADPALLELLERHDLLIDERAMMPLIPDQVHDLSGRHATAALARCVGDAAPAAHRARSSTRVQATGFGHPAGRRLVEQFEELLAGVGLWAATPADPYDVPPRVGALLGIGEPDRDLLDAWTRARTPYVLVRMTEGRATVGPFVVPGRTACLRCVDAHCADADPAWPLLVRQYAAASAHDRADGAPEPVDPLLASVAVSWAARDLASFVDGCRPSTWSATVSFDPQLSELETRTWLRHPACGCG